jgi:integrase
VRGRRGEGGITKHTTKNGSTFWEVRITFENGVRKSWYAKTRREADQILTKAKRERDLGALVAYDERQTVAQYLTSWLDTVKSSGAKARGFVRYESDVRLHLIPAIGALKLAKLTPQHLQRLYAATVDAGYSPASVAHLHAVIHAALDQAVRHNVVGRNVADLVKAPRAEASEMRILTKEQVEQLLVAAADDRLFALYLLAVRTGMRQGELLALQWADVDLEQHFCQVRHTLSYSTGATWHLTAPKTKKSRRRVDLSPSVVEALRLHRHRQRVERLAAGADWNAADFVFCTPVGAPWRGTHIYARHFLPLLRRAKLPAVRFHDLRHTCASLLLQAHVDIKIVSELLGHSSVAITWDRYTHIAPSQKRDAASAMESLFSQA